jgi:hypothetical protein
MTNWLKGKWVARQVKQPRPLPVGMKEFDEWADRLITGSMLPADKESLKFALASLVLTIGPTESHKPDAFFIHGLRKAAANQIAHAKMQEMHASAKERLTKEDKALSLVKPPEEAS